MPKVSIIVPVYNASRYLQECVQNVKLQSFKDWELLLINDGSSDGSAELCDQLASTDSRIRVFHKPNTGVSDTRNHGLDMASGEYVIFLDADDYWVDNTALERMYNLAKTNNLDVIRGEYKAVDDNGEELFCREISKEGLYYANRLLSSYQFLKYAIHGEYFLVLSLIKREIIGHTRFNTQRIFLEDVLLYSEILLKPLRTMYMPTIRFYAYRKYQSSVSNKANPKKLQDAFDMCYEFHRLVDITKDNGIRHIFEENSIKMYYYTLDTISLEEYYIDKSKYIKEFELASVRRDVVRWMYEYSRLYFSPIYFLSPYWGVLLFRFRHKLGRVKRRAISVLIKK